VEPCDVLPLHLDDLTGAMTDAALRLFGRSSVDSSAGLPAYEGLPVDAMFPAPQAIPAGKTSTRWWVPGLVSEDIVLPSLHEPLAPFRERYGRDYPETQTIYARRIRPASARRRPRLLYLHGYMQPETVLEEVAVLSTMALWLDVEVIQMQPPYHGRRSPRGTLFSGECYWTADLVRSVEALRQTMIDARTLLGWLLAEDPRPVGLMGLSLGGALTAALTCLDDRFAFSIALVGHMDLAAMLADVPVLAGMRRDLQRFGWEPAEFRRFCERMGWYDLKPLLPPDRIHMFAGSDDRFFAPATVTDMWMRWGRPEIHWYPSSHMGFLVRLPDVIGRVRAIVDRHHTRGGYASPGIR
jgi:pimeloyl-ACP methyl ester carboxylesterase